MGPLGIVVIAVVVVCLVTSAWLCCMMHRRAKKADGGRFRREVCDSLLMPASFLVLLCSIVSGDNVQEHCGTAVY